MKAIISLIFLMLGIVSGGMGQNIIDLTFTAVDTATYVQLDSIKVMNRTQGGDTMIYWPDTTLSLAINQGDLLLYIGYATFYQVGVSEVINESSSFEVYQNYPNPMVDRSDISMYIPHTGKVHVMITDLQGRVILRTDRQLDGGHHSFRFYSGGGNFYFLTVHWNGMSRSIRMISTGQQDGKSCRLDYEGTQSGEPVLKNSLQVNDSLIRQSGILDTPEGDTSYTFQFATNIPCPGMPTVEYEGQVYNTIQIFSQCWLKENLNVGIMIAENEEMTDNGILEKYCYSNEPDSCTKYGGLYQWNEMMQYTTQQGTQGICPPDWHIPTDEEWKVLEGALDSQYGIGDQEWDDGGDRGFDVGKHLKTVLGWYENTGTDAYGFSALPGGNRCYDGGFHNNGCGAHFWSSMEYYNSCAWGVYLSYHGDAASRYDCDNNYGYSLRCVKD